MKLVLTCRYKIISLPLTFCNVVLLFSFKTLPFLKSCTEPDYHQRPRTLPKTKLVDIIDSFLAQQLHQQCCRYLPFFSAGFQVLSQIFPLPSSSKEKNTTEDKSQHVDPKNYSKHVLGEDLDCIRGSHTHFLYKIRVKESHFHY